MLADSTCGVKGREGGIKEDSRALEQLCRWLVVLFTEMGNIERIWGVKDKLHFAMLSVGFVTHIEVEIVQGGGEMNNGRQEGAVGKVSQKLQRVVETNRRKCALIRCLWKVEYHDG